MSDTIVGLAVKEIARYDGGNISTDADDVERIEVTCIMGPGVKVYYTDRMEVFIPAHQVQSIMLFGAHE